MQIKNLYKYEREEGKITVSPIKPNNIPYELMYRLIADEDKLLTKNNEEFFEIIDTDTTEDWYEVDKPEEQEALDE